MVEMADLAESIDDLICTFDHNILDMDRVALYAFVACAFVLSASILFWTLRKRRDKKSLPGSDDRRREAKDAECGREVAKKSKAADGRPVLVATSTPIKKTKKTTAYYPAPQCIGSDLNCVLWANDLFAWIWNDADIVDKMTRRWIDNLNESIFKLTKEQEHQVQLIRLLPQATTPALENVTCENVDSDTLEISGDFDARPAFELKCSHGTGTQLRTSYRRVFVSKFHGRLKIIYETIGSLLSIKFSGWPEIEITFASDVPNNTTDDNDQVEQLLRNILQTSLRTTEESIDLSNFKKCPKLANNLPAQEVQRLIDANKIVSIDNDLKQLTYNKKLLIKINEVQNLSEVECKNVYCVVELDEPLQKNQTEIEPESKSLVWNQLFFFDLSNASSELLFEVYEQPETATVTSTSTSKFLGHSIISIEDLKTSHFQKHVLSLQNKPFVKSKNDGRLLIETVICENDELSSILNDKEQLIEFFNSKSNTLEKNATKSVNSNGVSKNHASNENNSEIIIVNNIVETPAQSRESSVCLDSADEQSSKSDRRKLTSRRRNFFGTIKRKLRKTKEERNDSIRESSRNGTDLDLSRSSRRSSVSEESGCSGFSSKTFLADDSNLVLEVHEPDTEQPSYYSLPNKRYKKIKLKKKFAKLHVYNDHVFVARHIFGNEVCEVCKKAIGMKFWKQYYECRSCSIKCHKPCHVDVPDLCPKPTISTNQLKPLPDDLQPFFN